MKTLCLLLFIIVSSCALFAQTGPVSALEEPSKVISSDSSMALVTVGDPGNDADPATGCGAVEKSFSIGRFEVTAAQYCAFLNAVAADADPYDLYDFRMGSDDNVKCITRSEGEPPYSYTIIEDGKNRGQFPITYVSLYNAARFCNWMEHGCPSTDPDHLVTETGAYTLNEEMRGPLARVPGATWFIPNEDELYKSIYYQGGGLHAGYYPYPNRSLNYPVHTIGQTNDEANCRNAFDHGARSEAPYLTPVGIFSTSVSAYGACDTGGNVDEWTTQEESTDGSVMFYVIRGGSWKSSYSYSEVNDLQKESRHRVDAMSKSNTLGFRIASSLVAADAVVPTTKAPAESQWTMTEIAGILGLIGLGTAGGYGAKKGYEQYRAEPERNIKDDKTISIGNTTSQKVPTKNKSSSSTEQPQDVVLSPVKSVRNQIGGEIFVQEITKNSNHDPRVEGMHKVYKYCAIQNIEEGIQALKKNQMKQALEAYKKVQRGWNDSTLFLNGEVSRAEAAVVKTPKYAVFIEAREQAQEKFEKGFEAHRTWLQKHQAMMLLHAQNGQSQGDVSLLVEQAIEKIGKDLEALKDIHNKQQQVRVLEAALQQPQEGSNTEELQLIEATRLASEAWENYFTNCDRTPVVDSSAILNQRSLSPPPVRVTENMGNPLPRRSISADRSENKTNLRLSLSPIKKVDTITITSSSSSSIQNKSTIISPIIPKLSGNNNKTPTKNLPNLNNTAGRILGKGREGGNTSKK